MQCQSIAVNKNDEARVDDLCGETSLLRQTASGNCFNSKESLDGADTKREDLFVG